MVRFYDTNDEKDLARVEELLRKHGIEYCLVSDTSRWPVEIQVAEEDVAKAETLLLNAAGN